MGGLFSKLKDVGKAKWGDLSGGEKALRVGEGAFGGLGKGLSNYQQQNAPLRQGGGVPAIDVTPTPQVDTGADPDYLMNFLRQNQNPYATSAFGR